MQFKQEAEANGTLLPARHPASRLVSKIGMRIAGVAQTDNHGQPIKHMKVRPCGADASRQARIAELKGLELI